MNSVCPAKVLSSPARRLRNVTSILHRVWIRETTGGHVKKFLRQLHGAVSLTGYRSHPTAITMRSSSEFRGAACLIIVQSNNGMQLSFPARSFLRYYFLVAQRHELVFITGGEPLLATLAASISLIISGE